MTSGRKSLRFAAAAAAAAFAITAVPAASANAAEVERLRLIGPAGNFGCPLGDNVTGQDEGFGSVVTRKSEESVSAVINIAEGQPNTAYHIRLVQISPQMTDCYRGVAIVTTNSAGIGRTTMSESILSEATGFQVSVNTGDMFGAPHWVLERTVVR